MLPSIQFNFLICTYLPGLPFALSMYIAFVVPNIDPNSAPKELQEIWVPYLLIAPLLAGLIVDAIRHAFATIFSGENSIFWQSIEKTELQNFNSNYGDAGASFIFGKLATLYHVFEFFFNSAISTFFGLIALSVGWEKLTTGWVVLLLAAIFVFFVCSMVFRKLQQDLISKYA